MSAGTFCDACGSRKETDRPEWVFVRVHYQYDADDLDFCDFKCLSVFALAKAAER